MGLIQNLLNSTTERVSIPEVRKAGYVQALQGLRALRPDLARDGVLVTSRSWACRATNPERPTTSYRFGFRVPAGFDQPLAFLSIHRSDLEPVQARVLSHNRELGNLFVLFRAAAPTAEPQTVDFSVSHHALSLPAGRQQLVAVFGLASVNGQLRVAERLPLLADIETDQFAEIAATELDESGEVPVNAAMLEAVVGLSLFVAFADGHYDRKEEQVILAALLEIDAPPAERRLQFLGDLQEAARTFRYRKDILDEHCHKARLGLTLDGRVTLVRILFSVATIDGILHANEEKLLRYVAAQIDTPVADVQALIDGFFALSH